MATTNAMLRGKLFLHLLFLLVGGMNVMVQAGTWMAEINVSVPIAVTDPNFLGFNLDTSNFDATFPPQYLGSVKANTLLRGLSPTVLRVGGSSADYLFFNRPQKQMNAAQMNPAPYTMPTSGWDFLVNLTMSANLRLLFCLNLGNRFDKQWSPSQAIELFEYSKAKGYGSNLDWELGNEPSHFHGTSAGQIPGEQLGDDYLSLRRIIDTYSNMAGSRLVGPDVVGIYGQSGVDFMKWVATKAGSKMDALTFHHYYMRGDTAKWQDYVDPGHFENLARAINQVRSSIKDTPNPNMKLWIGETSDAWHSGTENVSDRYVSGFLWMDKLGLGAKMGLGAILRQTFYGGYYALTDSELNPNPDYWLSWLYRNLVGPQVLSVNISNYVQNPPTLRVYAQCTKRGGMYPDGAVTFFTLNVHANNTELIYFPEPLFSQKVDAYVLTPDGPDGLLSKFVALNGKRLALVDDHTLPKPVPFTQEAADGIKVAPRTFAFYVFPQANAPACR